MKFRISAYDLVYFAITTLIIIIPALFNGYPFVHQDSGQYLAVSQSFDTKGYAPVGYSYFIRIVSWQTLVWSIIVIQALIMNLYLYYSWKIYLKNKSLNFRTFHLVTLVLLSIFTGLGWYTSLIMPDAFTAYMIFAVFFMIRKESPVWVRIVNGIFIFWAGISHLSNTYTAVLILIILLVVYFFVQQYRSKISLISVITILPLIVLSNLFIRSYNYSHDYGFVTTRYKSGALMAKFVEYGMLEDYLLEHCPEEDFLLCDFIEKLPNTTGGFIWNPDSPYNKGETWESVSEEYSKITAGIISDPNYLLQYFSKSIYSSLKQITRINIYFPPRRAETSPFIVIKDRFRNDFQSYKSSLQYWDKLDLALINNIYYILYILAGMYLLIRLFKRNLDKSRILFPVVIISGVISNAIAAGTLATVVDRFQSRIAWMLIFLAVVIFIQSNYGVIQGFRQKIHDLAKNENS